jgi:hypothetical protein
MKKIEIMTFILLMLIKYKNMVYKDRYVRINVSMLFVILIASTMTSFLQLGIQQAHAQASLTPIRSINVIIANQTPMNMILVDQSKVDLPPLIRSGETYSSLAASYNNFYGVEGYATYYFTPNLDSDTDTSKQMTFHFDNPYVGSNSCSVDQSSNVPFTATINGDCSGNDATMSVTVSG